MHVFRQYGIAGIVATVFFVLLFFAAAGRAQIGFTAYVGGVLPVGEFSRTDINREDPKSGAENGHSLGAGVAWSFMLKGNRERNTGLDPIIVTTFGYSESEFGHDVPTVVVGDTLQFATPESRIRMRGIRLGVRFIPWASHRISPTFGAGFQRQKIKVDSWAFQGPAPGAAELYDPLPLRVTFESGEILGGFFHAGFITEVKRSAIFFTDVNYHFLFSEGVSTTTSVTVLGETDTEEGKIKSNRQWWELRAGLLFFLGS